MKKRPVLWSLAILSAGTLALEIDLSRLLAVAQFYHLSFMVVSLALLGFGASGTLLAVWPGLRAYSPRRVLRWSGWCFAATTLCGYLVTVYLPFDSFSVAVDWRQWGVLALHYLVLATPFACTGLAVGLLLVVLPEHGHRFYAANLVGCVGMEEPAALFQGFVMECLSRLRQAEAFAPESWETLPEFVAATRFAWLSDWLRRGDREMVEMEAAYIRLLMNHRQRLAERWA